MGDYLCPRLYSSGLIKQIHLVHPPDGIVIAAPGNDDGKGTSNFVRFSTLTYCEPEAGSGSRRGGCRLLRSDEELYIRDTSEFVVENGVLEWNTNRL